MSEKPKNVNPERDNPDDTPETPNEQEISLDQGAPIPPKGTFGEDSVARKVIEEDGRKKYDLSPKKGNIAKESASSAEVVDLILSTNLDQLLPWERIQLPSMGLFYGGAIPEGIVEVRPTGLTADKILATARLTQSGQALDYIFKRYVRFPNAEFDPADLLVGDRTFLLFYLRGITHGNMYEFKVECTNEQCKASSFHSYDLNYMAENIQYPQVKQEPVQIELPYLTMKMGRRVYCEARFMRGRDLKVLEQRRKFTNKAIGETVRSARTGKQMSRQEIIDRDLEESMYLLITSVNGVKDAAKITKLIRDKMSSSDIQAVNEYLNNNSPGVDLRVTITCPECGTEMTMQLPLTETFFRPQVGRAMRE